MDRCKINLMGAPGTTATLEERRRHLVRTVISIAESPVTPGVVWAGTDDGNLQLSRDGGTTFTEVGKNIRGPAQAPSSGTNPYWISRIDASHFDAATAYVAVDGHRSDDLAPYVFVTHDYGRTFRRISSGLPVYGNVQAISEDPKNTDLLYVGTEFGLFISLDAGGHWDRFMTNYPTVRTDEIVVHPRDGDLIVATHGRSLWIADDITPLQQFTPAVAAQDVALFDVRPAIAYLFDYRTDADEGGEKRFDGENPPRGTAINYYLRVPATGGVTLSIADASGHTVCTEAAAATAGIHRVQWTLVAPLLSSDSAGGRGAGSGGGRGDGRGVSGARDTTCDGSGGRGGAGGAAGAGGAGAGRGGATPPLAAGAYTAKLTVNGKDYTKPITVLQDTGSMSANRIPSLDI